MSLRSVFRGRAALRNQWMEAEYRLEECMALMSKMKIRHLPVIHDGRAIAVLSMSHIMEALVEENEFMIAELTKYVTGSNLVSPVSSRH